MNTILVTGGAGYVGSHTCKALALGGYRPVAVDSLVNGHESAAKWGPLERADISDTGLLQSLLHKYRPIAVMHFAAFAYVGESVAEPSKYYLNNVVGSLRLLEACRAAGVSKFVFSSSCATYGIPTCVPINEAHPQSPVSPYGSSKLMVENILRDYDSAYGLRSVSLRYFNAAGADPDGEIGERHEPETHLIPLVLRSIAGVGPLVTIFGRDYPTPDGTCIRDYVHVADLADGHVRALAYLIAGGSSVALNLGTGKGHSVLEVIDTAKQITGKIAPHAIGVRRPGDPPVLVADPARAMSVLGWRPRYSDLDEIVATAWAWHRSRS